MTVSREFQTAVREAAAYNAAHQGVSFYASIGGELILEAYPKGASPDQPHEIASGTKSFAGIAAVAGVADGLFTFDEVLAQTLYEWQEDPRKTGITLRQLLQLVSGLEAGGKPGSIPDYGVALRTAAVAKPGEKFFYGSAPFQVFGEFLRRKLIGRAPDALAYLRARVFEPIGLHVGRWRHGRDGNPSFASGAALSAREWAKLGELICRRGQHLAKTVLPADLLAQCFRGSKDNPAYGLSWWLNAPLPDSERMRLRQVSMGLEDLTAEPLIPPDLVYAAGAGKQRLYVSPSLGLVVVRQASGMLQALAEGEQGGFSDLEFLRLLLRDRPL